jgi:uroporphyrinogen decarboxylase
MRTDIKDRFYRTYTYQEIDRVPDIEFGYWPQTIRRWLDEGLPLELTPAETNQSDSRKLNKFFGFENEGWLFNTSMEANPWFDVEIIERKDRSVIIRDPDGIVAERFLDDSDESSIPHFIEFPVKSPDDWADIKERYRLDDPVRITPDDTVNGIRKAQAAGKSIIIFLVGFYGQLRNWMGMEALSYAFYDYPDMIRDMVECWAELAARQIENLPEDIVIDELDWWEDMACNNGPLVSPSIFREFLQPGYNRVMTAAKKRGCVISMVDCDGNPHDIVSNWLEEGVNIMFPIEVAAGVDPYAWREEFGMELRLRGGIAKRPIAEGGQAIDRELERIRPLLEQGGYIPHIDHRVPPDVPYKHYCEYLEKKRRLIGR